MRTAALLVSLLVVSCAHGGGQSWSWRPYSAVRSVGAPVALRAIEVLEGDVDYVADAQLVGTLAITDAGGSEALCEAAHHGGTHVVHKSHSSRVTGSETSSGGASGAALWFPGRTVWSSAASTQITTAETDVYAVLRVDPKRWAELPEPLRPLSVDAYPGSKLNPRPAEAKSWENNWHPKPPVDGGPPKDLWECRTRGY